MKTVLTACLLSFTLIACQNSEAPQENIEIEEVIEIKQIDEDPDLDTEDSKSD